MRIIIQDYAGHPFPIHLSRNLAKKGWDILHIFNASDITPNGKMKKLNSDSSKFNIIGILIPGGFNKYSFFSRFKQERYYGNQVISEIIKFKPDIVVNANTPMAAYHLINRHLKKTTIKSVFWMQDFYSIAAIKILRKKIPVVGIFIGLYFKHIEKSILHDSDFIILITESFKRVLHRWGIAQDKVSVIPNWSPIEDLPAKEKLNNWKYSSEIAEYFNVVYTGTLAYKHNPKLLLHLSKVFKDYKDLKLILTSEGKVVEKLKVDVKKLNIKNILILPFQPFEFLPDVMATADILIALLEDDAGEFSVPSKVLTYHCAARPILLIGPEDNLASRIINENKTGLAINSSKIHEAVDFINKIYSKKIDKNKFGENARKYAEENFPINTITKKFESIFNNIS